MKKTAATACGLALCALAALSLPVGLRAQTVSNTTVVQSALHSIYEGHTLLMTVADLGSTAAASTVTVEFRDTSNQRRASDSATLTRGTPVRLRLSLPAGSGLTQLRAVVTITPRVGGSVPIVSLEDLDANTLVIRTLPPSGPIHIPDGGGFSANCGPSSGWVVFAPTPQAP